MLTWIGVYGFLHPRKTTIIQHCYDSNRYDIASMDIERTFDAGIDGTGRSIGHMMALDLRVGVRQAMYGSVFGDDGFRERCRLFKSLFLFWSRLRRDACCVCMCLVQMESGDELFDWRLWVRRVWSVETVVPCEGCCHGQELELSSLVVREVMSQTEVWIGFLGGPRGHVTDRGMDGFLWRDHGHMVRVRRSLNGEELGFATSVRRTRGDSRRRQRS